MFARTLSRQAQVGVIGIGKMGAAIATNLANAGHTIVAYDLNTEVSKRSIQPKSHIVLCLLKHGQNTAHQACGDGVFLLRV